MKIDDDIRALTWALHRHRSLDAVCAALPTHLGSRVVVEAAAAFVLAPRAPYRSVIQVLEMLGPVNEDASRWALVEALEHRLIKVRRAAAQSLLQTPGPLPWARIARRLRLENAYLVRVALVDLLASAPSPWREEVLMGCDDPHWRVRKQVMVALDRWEARGEAVELRAELGRRGIDGDRSRGVLAYRALYAQPEAPLEGFDPEDHGGVLEPDLQARPWWHEEPSLMLARLATMGRQEVRREQPWLVWLLSHPNPKLRSMLLERLHPVLEPGGLRSFLLHASERRRAGLDQTQDKLLMRVLEDTTEACAWGILTDAAAGDALTTGAGIGPLDLEPGPLVRWAMRWLGRHVTPTLELTSRPVWRGTLEVLFVSPDPADRACALSSAHAVGLQRDEEVRAALEGQDDRVAQAALSHRLTTEQLRDLVSERHERVSSRYQEALIDALARDGIEPNAQVWSELCEDPDPSVRARAAFHLVQAWEAASGMDAQAQDLKAMSASRGAEVQRASQALLEALERERMGAVLRSKLQVLQRDEVARVREAAMTKERAEEVLLALSQETSWRVLERAASLCTKRLESLVPSPWTKEWEERPPTSAPRIEVTPREPSELRGCGGWWEKRQLGPTPLRLSKMGISGHYALPEEGFAEALERGINAYFWEPIYLSQTRFFRPLSASVKADLVMSAGTFEASARGLRRDVERALQAMELEQIQLFFVFWVRSPDRLSPELLYEMERCQREGLVGTFGVSTHSRALAVDLMEQWPVVMVRHNAAHRGVEREVLPKVDPQKTGILTFSNLCYGRMISELPGWDRGVPSATDAYRYSLSHEGVSGCWSAPSTVEQLRENLRALELGPMTAQELEEMRAYGDALYRLNTGFNRYVRLR